LDLGNSARIEGALARFCFRIHGWQSQPRRHEKQILQMIPAVLEQNASPLFQLFSGFLCQRRIDSQRPLLQPLQQLKP
jgi:hypothetical protein